MNTEDSTVLDPDSFWGQLNELVALTERWEWAGGFCFDGMPFNKWTAIERRDAATYGIGANNAHLGGMWIFTRTQPGDTSNTCNDDNDDTDEYDPELAVFADHMDGLIEYTGYTSFEFDPQDNAAILDRLRAIVDEKPWATPPTPHEPAISER